MAAFEDPGHLPNLREGGTPPPPEGLPRQRRGTTPQRHGRYPDYDVLELAPHWDELTREVILDRAHNVPPRRFFTEEEARTVGAFCDVVLAQDAEPRVPVLETIDQRLHSKTFDGYRYANMPEDDETWRKVAHGLDEAAGGPFGDAPEELRHSIVKDFSSGRLAGGVWEEIECSSAWSVVMRYVLAAFYAHPWAWNEIGYGGPRYPRGYMRLGAGRREPGGAREAFDVDPVGDVGERGVE